MGDENYWHFKNAERGYTLEIPGYQIGAPIVNVSWSQNKVDNTANYAIVRGRLIEGFEDPINFRSAIRDITQLLVFVDETVYNPAYAHTCFDLGTSRTHLYWSKYVERLEVATEANAEVKIPGSEYLSIRVKPRTNGKDHPERFPWPSTPPIYMQWGGDRDQKTAFLVIHPKGRLMNQDRFANAIQSASTGQQILSGGIDLLPTPVSLKGAWDVILKGWLLYKNKPLNEVYNLT